MTDTPVTKLYSVERIVEKYCPEHNAINDEPGREEGFYHCSHCAEIINARFRTALAEMWDLSRREALREAVEFVRENGAPYAADKLERLAVEAVTR